MARAKDFSDARGERRQLFHADLQAGVSRDREHLEQVIACAPDLVDRWLRRSPKASLEAVRTWHDGLVVLVEGAAGGRRLAAPLRGNHRAGREITMLRVLAVVEVARAILVCAAMPTPPNSPLPPAWALVLDSFGGRA